MRSTELIAGGVPFYTAFADRTTLIKAKEEDGKWITYLEASNEIRDQDLETTLMKALKDCADYYLTHGVISFDHKHKELNDPSFIIGEPLAVAFTKDNRTLVKGMLYKENKIAQGIFENLLSESTRFGSSIGGYILHKSNPNTPKAIIDKVFWDETAITHKPVNDATLGKVTLIPMTEFAKALMAGGGTNAAEFTGGRALTPENMASATAVISTVEAETLFKDIWRAIDAGEVNNYLSLIGFIVNCGYTFDVARKIARFLFDKLPFAVSNI